MGYGVVEELNGRSVVIRTVDGRILHLPNGKLREEPFANPSTLGGRRSEVSVECNSADRVKTIEAIARAVATTEGVLPDPAPSVVPFTVDERGITLLLCFWHEPTLSSIVTARVVDSLAASIDATEVTYVGPVRPVYSWPQK